MALNECSDVVLAVTVDRGLAEATHIGIGGDGLILGHLITHLHHDVSTCQALLGLHLTRRRGDTHLSPGKAQRKRWRILEDEKA